ncbi:MAG: lipopolysaccharide biosynthesis protein [Treponema sp.]|jgi:uncharacterized protein involved in exopolysaccharide biosynthesis|nr:lipopolysaccharide biosynthesis protein [Treponema sp.]
MNEPDFERSEREEDEISLIDLFLTLWRHRILILVISLCASIIVLGYSAISLKLPPEESFLPNLYTSKANMLINNNNSSGSGNIAAALNANGLGGLANIAGINVSGGSAFSSLAVYLVNSDTMLDSIVKEFDLITRYSIKDHVIGNSRKGLKKNLKAEYDTTSNVFTISFSDYDPVFACNVVDYCVDYLSRRFDILGLDKSFLQKENLEKSIAAAYEAIRNLEGEIQSLELSAANPRSGSVPNIVPEIRRINVELNAQQQIYAQLKVQLELTNTAIASETPIFQVLDAPQVPDLKSGPSRGMLCIIVTMGAFFFSIFLAFVLNALENIKNDPAVIAKFKSVGRNKNAAVHNHVA